MATVKVTKTDPSGREISTEILSIPKGKKNVNTKNKDRTKGGAKVKEATPKPVGAG